MTHIDLTVEAARDVYLRIGRKSQTIDQAASDAAWGLLIGFARHRMEDGTVMVADTGGRWHSLCVVDDLALRAAARPRDGNGSQATLSHSLSRALQDICLGVWCSRNFLPALGNVGVLPEMPFADSLPYGLETLAIALVDPEQRYLLEKRRELLNRASFVLDENRKVAAVKTYYLALRWLWAHELGHLVQGHDRTVPIPPGLQLLPSDLSKLSYGIKRNEAARDYLENGEVPPKKVSMVLGLEILADHFANERLFRSTTLEDSAGTLLTVIAAMIVLSLIEMEFLVEFKPWETRTHPGSWFRARAVIDQARCSVAQSLTIDRFVIDVARALGHFGNWIGSVFEDGTREVAESLRQQAMDALEPHLGSLRQYEAQLVIDDDGLSTDLMAAKQVA
jgi:hypothetical protein